MTLAELKERVDIYYNMNPQYHDLEVCIPNGKGGMGGLSTTKVQYANKGIDWDAGKFFLSPEVPMIEKPQPKSKCQHLKKVVNRVCTECKEIVPIKVTQDFKIDYDNNNNIIGGHFE
jgi:hypothetical protein